MQKYYKVVTKDLKSAWLGENMVKIKCLGLSKFIIKYKVGKFVKPLAGNLMVFDSFDAARYWIDYTFDTSSLHNIYECEVKNIIPRNKAFFVYTNPANIVESLNEYLKLRTKHKSTKSISRHGSIPEGTVFCKQVKLTNLIEK